MLPPVEFRAQMAAGDVPGTITGTAVPLGVPIVQGGFTHVIAPGTFAAQAKDPARVKILFNHDRAQPIGKISLLAETDGRLMFAGLISESTQAGRETMSLIREGVLDEVSVGFEWGKWAQNGSTFTHTRARLSEISVVSAGAAGRDAVIETAAAATRPTVAQYRAFIAGLE